MNAGLIRLGGILAFVLVALAMIATIVPLDREVSLPLAIAQTVLVIFVLWSTKALFNNRGYSRANAPVIGLIAVILVAWLLAVFGFQFMGGRPGPQAGGSGLAAARLMALVVVLVLFVLLVWFSVGAVGFGRQAGGGGSVWIAVGTLYIAAIALITVIAIALAIFDARGTDGAAPFLAASLVTPVFMAGFTTAVWICHGIGLLMGANRMS